MAKRKNSGASRDSIVVRALKRWIRVIQKAEDGLRVCPKCRSLYVYQAVGGQNFPHHCDVCGFSSVFFPKFSVKDLKRLAVKKSKKALQRKRKNSKKRVKKNA